MRLIRYLAAAAVVMFALQLFSDNKADVDLWGNLGFVTAMPWSNDFAYTNTYAFNEPGHPWINHEWLAQWLMRRAWDWGGHAGALGLKLALGLAVLALMHRALRRDCPTGPVRFFLMLLLISTMGYGFSIRPHHFTYLFLAVFLTVLRGPPLSAARHLAFTAVAGILWGNLHGAFFIGAIVLLIHAVCTAVSGPWHDRLQRRRAGVLFAGVAVYAGFACINPYGLLIWDFIVDSGGIMRPYLSEWAPFHPGRHLLTHPDFVVLVLLTGLALARPRAPRALLSVTLTVAALIAALGMRRNIPLFAIVLAFTTGRAFEAAAGAPVRSFMQRVPARAQIVTLALFLPVSAVYGLRVNKQDPFTIEIPAADYPLQTVAFMRGHAMEANLFVFFDWAEYCIWHLYPECRVFMDGRFRSAYSREAIHSYLTILYAQEGWREFLRASETDAALLHTGNPLARELARLPEWAILHAAGPAVLFVRRDRHAERLRAMEAGRLQEPQPIRPVFP